MSEKAITCPVCGEEEEYTIPAIPVKLTLYVTGASFSCHNSSTDFSLNLKSVIDDNPMIYIHDLDEDLKNFDIPVVCSHCGHEFNKEISKRVISNLLKFIND